MVFDFIIDRSTSFVFVIALCLFLLYIIDQVREEVITKFKNDPCGYSWILFKRAEKVVVKKLYQLSKWFKKNLKKQSRSFLLSTERTIINIPELGVDPPHVPANKEEIIQELNLHVDNTCKDITTK